MIQPRRRFLSTPEYTRDWANPKNGDNYVAEWLPEIVTDPLVKEMNARLKSVMDGRGHTEEVPFLARTPPRHFHNINGPTWQIWLKLEGTGVPPMLCRIEGLLPNADGFLSLDERVVALLEKRIGMTPEEQFEAMKRRNEQAERDKAAREKEALGIAFEESNEALTAHADNPEFRRWRKDQGIDKQFAGPGADLTSDAPAVPDAPKRRGRPRKAEPQTTEGAS